MANDTPEEMPAKRKTPMPIRRFRKKPPSPDAKIITDEERKLIDAFLKKNGATVIEPTSEEL